MALSDEDVREILRIADQSDLEELSIETPGFSLTLRRGVTRAVATPPVAGATAQNATAAPVAADGAQAPPQAPGPPAPAGATAGATAVIVAPMLGTFYRAESPTHAPFVEVGDRVAADSVVCLIEVMKLMNQVQAGVSGTIVEVLAAGGSLVEFEQPLFAVAPDA